MSEQPPPTAPVPEGRHPIWLVVNDDLERSRLTVFFRLLLVIPHVLWLLLWGIVIELAAIVAWFATLFGGRCPAGLHDFIARYLTYMTHVSAYLFLIADPYPSFSGRTGYPVDLEVDPPERQNRWATGSTPSKGWRRSSRSSAGSSAWQPAGCRGECAISRRTACDTRRRRTATSCC